MKKDGIMRALPAEVPYTADMGNGTYRNPIFNGDFPDPSILRVDHKYYMVHSSFGYHPGLEIWSSTDLVNWSHLCYALNGKPLGLLAPDICRYGSRYYIYFPAHNSNWVTWADSPEGPWSQPTDLRIPGVIDPGHIADENGERYLFLSDGYAVRLSKDGLSTQGELFQAWPVWEYPEAWDTEGVYPESPKLTKKDGWYYLLTAQGGTAGPATSHMVVVFRSHSLLGPWEPSPYNPLIRTSDDKELFWSKGHGSLVDTPRGDWWIVYHAYENSKLNSGRKTLLEPVIWTEDGWPYLHPESKLERPIPKPFGNTTEPDFPTIYSCSMENGKLCKGIRAYGCALNERFFVKENGICLDGLGENPGGSCPMVVTPLHDSYEWQIRVSAYEGCHAGLILFYNEKAYCSIGIEKECLVVQQRHRRLYPVIPLSTNELILRMVKRGHTVSLFYDTGVGFQKFHTSIETSGYQHNVFGGFLALRPGFFAAGSGFALFRNFEYFGFSIGRNNI